VQKTYTLVHTGFVMAVMHSCSCIKAYDAEAKSSSHGQRCQHPRAWKFMLMGGRAHGLRSLVVDTMVTSARRLCSAAPEKRLIFHTCSTHTATVHMSLHASVTHDAQCFAASDSMLHCWCLLMQVPLMVRLPIAGCCVCLDHTWPALFLCNITT
jgi:hypothetical protein